MLDLVDHAEIKVKDKARLPKLEGGILCYICALKIGQTVVMYFFLRNISGVQ